MSRFATLLITALCLTAGHPQQPAQPKEILMSPVSEQDATAIRAVITGMDQAWNTP